MFHTSHFYAFSFSVNMYEIEYKVFEKTEEVRELVCYRNTRHFSHF